MANVSRVLAVAALACSTACSPYSQRQRDQYVQAGQWATTAPQVSDGVNGFALPKQWEKLSVDQFVYVTKRSNEFWVVFRNEWGRHADFGGVLFIKGKRTLQEGERIKVGTWVPSGIGEVEVNILSVMSTNLYRIRTDFLD
ncbi:MAG: hypothetical protein AB1705_04405 [Verrucomicrobiota bacterium]